ncbi:MAG: putative dipeptidase [Armatimonadetes bacterium OLB18]|nr:MAG: putative dipeptidase [Armatimonadetes bacterium OLB18]
MLSPQVERAQKWLRENEAGLLADTQRMLRIPSIEGEPQPGAPFGGPVRDALDLALELCRNWEMKTEDLEGFAGYGEFGEGDRSIAAFGHLDVVPTGPGWKYEPFGATVDDGYLYARGSTDDKGPTMAMLYAMRAVQVACPELKARFRMVFGCNEESGMRCLAHYNLSQAPPDFGLAPDSGWPLYHAEKGIANLTVEGPLPQGSIELKSMSGGQRPNIVIDRCEAVVGVDSAHRASVESALGDYWDANLRWHWNGDDLHLLAKGKAAHGAAPHRGDSAATRLLRALVEIAPVEERANLESLLDLCHISGVGLGIHGRDEVSEDLTSNLGIVKSHLGKLVLLFNVRYPVEWQGEEVRERCEKRLSECLPGFRVADFDDAPPLHFPLDHPLVATICSVYSEETGELAIPKVMGGGTYARMVPNTVSIGTGWKGDGNAHETDERLKVEHLFRMSRIYAHLLIRLAQLP